MGANHGQSEASQVIQTLSEAITEFDSRADTQGAEERGITLIWGDRLDGIQGYLGPAGAWKGWSDSLVSARQVGCGCSIVPRPVPGGFGRVVVIVPRAKAALKMRLTLASTLVRSGGEIWVAGHQRDGVKSAARELQALCGAAHLVRLKRRCRVLMAPLGPESAAAAIAQQGASSNARDVAQWRQEDSLQGVPGLQAALPIVSYPGVFSLGRLDAGTKVLLSYLASEPPRFKKGLDVGSGAGILGTWLALLRPHARVQLLDVSATACLASEQTLKANGIETEGGIRASVSHSTLDKLPPKAFDLIVSNPPRHEGREHSHELTVRLIEAMAERLKRGGALIMVTDGNKTIEHAVAEHFHRVVASKQQGSYRLWHVIR